MDNIFFGVDYYPEHWPRERWETDADLMKELGISVARMGEFAWSMLEPEEGRYEFGWLEEAISVLASRGIRTVLGTPSPTPPAWIIEKNPEILPVDSQGRIRGFGGRHHNCQSNAAYRAHIARMVRALAARFARNPHVAAWQIDNELGNSHQDLCHCASCAAAFRSWLKEKYGTVEELNLRWGTVFWSQSYGDFRQVPTPALTPNSHSPSLLLDWRRFHSDLIVDFQKMQADLLRAAAPNAVITHNFMGLFDTVDYYKLGKDLDFVSHDQYPQGFWDAPDPEAYPEYLAAALDLIRGIKGKNFWVMEQQAGPAGWEILGRTPRPGQLGLWTVQSIAHGADTVVYFRWRTCTVGTEQYWHGILPHSGKPGRRYAEIKETIADMVPILRQSRGAGQGAEAAILFSYEQNWALEIQPHHPDLEYIRHLLTFYTALAKENVPVDIVSAEADLSRYKLVIAPLQYLMTEERETRFADYVRSGGRLVLTMRTGVKDEHNRCRSDRELPGALGDLLGIEILDYDCLRAGPVPVVFGGVAYPCEKWADIPVCRGAEALAAYGSEYYAGSPALTRKEWGQGAAYYMATEPGAEFAAALARLFLGDAGLRPIAPAEAGVEFARRRLSDRDLVFVLNHRGQDAAPSIPDAWRPLVGSAKLPPYGYAVFEAPLP